MKKPYENPINGYQQLVNDIVRIGNELTFGSMSSVNTVRNLMEDIVGWLFKRECQMVLLKEKNPTLYYEILDELDKMDYETKRKLIDEEAKSK